LKLILALCLTLMPVPALAQGWGDLDALLTATLSPTGGNEASYWLPDSADPAQATQAIGILYAHIPGSAGSVSLHAGLFRKAGGAFSIAGQITGLFGSTPRDARYFPDHVELTTTMPAPGDPRCCPSLAQRWRIDLSTLQARAMN